MKRMRPERAATDLLPVSPRAGAERDNNCVLAFVLALVALQPQQHREKPGECGVGNVPMGRFCSALCSTTKEGSLEQTPQCGWQQPVPGSDQPSWNVFPPRLCQGSRRHLSSHGRVPGDEGLSRDWSVRVNGSSSTPGWPRGSCHRGAGPGWQQEGPWPSPCAPVSSAGTEANFPVRSPKCSPGKPSFSCRDPAGARRGPHTVNALAGPSPRLVWSWSGKNWNKFGGCCWGHCSHLT